MLDVASLTQPVAADDPCGPDLDAVGDVQYLNFFAGAESLLPMSFFEVVNANGERGRFDPKAVDFAGQFAAAQPLLARTRDLRLNMLLAKFSILNRDLDGFLSCLKATNLLLREQWEAVHPRGEDGDYALRAVTVEAIDVFPTVINPLQFLPLIENRRHGSLNYRAYQVAKGEIPAGDADVDGPDLATIERIVSETDLDTLKAASVRCAAVAAEIADIKAIWHEKLNSRQPISLDRLSGLVNGMAAWLAGLVTARDPAAIAAPVEDAVPVDAQVPPDMTGALTSSAQASAALAAAADYFARMEPSNPALLLVRQAQEMVGKSFIEVMRMLVPSHVESAVINIGRDKVFDLPIERMAELAASPSSTTEGDVQDIVFSIENRAQALGLLAKVASFFRAAEPSSPIPFLVDRARDLAQRDFLSLLNDVLPEGALKTIDKSH
ncbi:type VI secretion system ImpA family N-terminal domain-containing protein [Bradyrhizobium sp. ISRA443]|uniref:type VI secretion system protein TssA n=1 Tax=unclassified Bradyrhizobium TaxID=2631580 RepID=UPI002479B818|nr:MULTISPECIES: type VI secretion system ImpA family N-terminal domain-containing protein [unclassified Bradyrhizobium]WGR97042.1 type VI secretion system ImpA family N-terminal domain-containing protein [Bradyrhizobium sp. ISRA436]WGS03930.1 type VI secretion system ImpA family N-terminal domain-containing protein [Bradyrhizobium sp. ISRA437]WGS10813.1 type VI secretion system ImpA family N-terminal domain-containing protein [Bradyrhizobium sp. ISRA443]